MFGMIIRNKTLLLFYGDNMMRELRIVYEIKFPQCLQRNDTDDIYLPQQQIE